MPIIESPTNEIRAAGNDSANHMPDWAGLHPVPIIAFGTPSRPVERMMGAQSAVYRLVVMLERIRLPRKLPSYRASIAALLAKAVRNDVPIR